MEVWVLGTGEQTQLPDGWILRTRLDRQRVPEEVPWVNVGHVFLLSEGERES